MRKNLLKQLTMALLLMVAVPTLNAQMAHIGDILCEGDLIVSPASYNASTHTAIGVVFYVDQTGQHGWAIALEDAGSYTWGGNCVDTPLPNYDGTRHAIHDLDGYNNTRIVREHSTDHPAFYAVDFENGWYVPTIGQLNYLYGNLVEVNESLTTADGTIFPDSGYEYWSSTEVDLYRAWYLHSTGALNNYDGYYTINGNCPKILCSRSVRAARNF